MPFNGDPRASTAQWKKLRLTILERDGHRCTHPGCRAPATEVDHILEHHRGGTDHPTNLTSLCRPHHATKTAADANTARWAKQSTRRPPERHPGLR